MRRQDLAERLIDFAVTVYDVSTMFGNKTGNQHFSNQIIRSSSSTALNYGEALAAESKKDFIHKTKIVLKELRETYFALKIIYRIKMCKSDPMVLKAIEENNELISIFVKTIQTAEKNYHNNLVNKK